MTAKFQDARALLIGVSAYRHAARLPRAVIHDVDDIASVLADRDRGRYAPEHVRILRDDEATRAGILEGFRWLAESATPSTTVFVYFSGHGDRAKGERTWLVPVDGDWRDYERTAISDQELTDALRDIAAPRLVAVLDCCHAGGVWRVKGGSAAPRDPQRVTRPDPNFYQRLNRGSGRVILTSCAAHEKSHILEGARNSLFTHHLLAGLSGNFSDGKEVGVLDLFRAVKTISSYYRQTPVLWAEQVDSDFPVAACQPRQPGLDAAALVDRLCGFSPSRFEELVYRVDPEIARLELPRYERAKALVAAYAASHALPTLDYKIATLAKPKTAVGRALELVRGTAAAAMPGLHQRLAEGGSIEVPVAYHEVQSYLDWLAHEMAVRNGGELAHVPLDVAPVPDERLGGTEYAPRVEPVRVVQHVRRVLRILAGTARGGDHTTAQLASLDRRSRIVRHAVRTLLRSREPLVLLGDPGSGKSMTLREVARQIAIGERRSRRPRVVAYVVASRYRSSRGNTPGPVQDLIRESIPEEFRPLRGALPMLTAKRRLVVLFDGLDEMDRKLYTEHRGVERLCIATRRPGEDALRLPDQRLHSRVPPPAARASAVRARAGRGVRPVGGAVADRYRGDDTRPALVRAKAA